MPQKTFDEARRRIEEISEGMLSTMGFAILGAVYLDSRGRLDCVEGVVATFALI